MKLMIIDTGCANLSSVKFALERLGYRPIITDDTQALQEADKLLLPGVGTASFAMNNLKQKGLDAFIKTTKTPLLGICLGMQLLTSSSSEGENGEDTQTLGVIDMHTQKLSADGLPLPHMGWNSIHYKDHPLFDGVAQDAHVYFVHSYRVSVGAATLATTTYGETFSSVVGQDNYFGMQFHPEKSGKIGSLLLRNFVENI